MNKHFTHYYYYNALLVSGQPQGKKKKPEPIIYS